MHGYLVCVSPDCQREKDELRAQVRSLTVVLVNERRVHGAHEAGQAVLQRAVDRAVAVLSEASGIGGKASLEGVVKAAYAKIVALEADKRDLSALIESMQGLGAERDKWRSIVAARPCEAPRWNEQAYDDLPCGECDSCKARQSREYAGLMARVKELEAAGFDVSAKLEAARNEVTRLRGAVETLTRCGQRADAEVARLREALEDTDAD